MANIKISALPAANEIWNLNEIIPVVNSGSTTTSKRTYGSLFSNHSGGTYTITSTDQTYAIIACGSNSPQTHIRVGGINNAAVISSRGANIASGQMNTIIGSEQSSDSQQPKIDGGQYNTIIGSYGNTYTVGGNHGFISNSRNSTFGGNSYQTIMGSENNQVNGTYSGSLGANGGTNDGSYQWFIGTNNATNYASSYHAVIGVSDYTTNSPSMDYNFTAGSSSITNGNSGSTDYNITLGCSSLQNNHERSAMISVNGSNSKYSATTHTDNLHTFKGESTEWRQGGNVSGAINVDLSEGNLFSFTITGNLTNVQLNNGRMGGEYEFFVYNSGSFTLSTMTLDGVTGSVFSAGGSLNPTNNGYSYYRLRIVDDGAGNKRGVMKEFLNYSAV